MIFLSAGHHFKAPKPDPGAIGNGYKENELTKELRDLIAAALSNEGYAYVVDHDSETLGEYIGRIRPGTGSVVCEVHFNASDNLSAKGVEVLYQSASKVASFNLATQMSDAIAKIAGFTNRGAKDESTSHRGRLAILHTQAGIAVLPEICFISNAEDMAKYQFTKKQIANAIAVLLMKYEDLYK